MVVNALTKSKAIVNLDHLVDVEVLLGFSHALLIGSNA
jgi:hypothetical protein